MFYRLNSSYIRLLPLGLSKPVKKLVQENLPDLSNFKDISEFIEKYINNT